MLLSVLLTSCVTDDGGCGCVTPPGPDERLVVSLKNEDGDNLLLPNAFGYVSEEQLTFYLLTAERTINLTQAQRNNSIISEYISDTDGSYEIQRNRMEGVRQTVRSKSERSSTTNRLFK